MSAKRKVRKRREEEADDDDDPAPRARRPRALFISLSIHKRLYVSSSSKAVHIGGKGIMRRSGVFKLV